MEKAFVLEREGRKTPCILLEPDFGAPQRVVLGVHGLCGSRTDKIQCSLAEEMGIFGAATLRFDFPAHGENPCKTLTLAGCQDTLLDVADYARERYPDLELCIFATGFGAYLTLNVMPELMAAGRVKLVIQTPSFQMDKTILRMKGMNQVTLEALGGVTFGSRRPVAITLPFFEELRQNPARMIIPQPVLVLYGDADTFISREDVLMFRTVNDQARLVTISGVSHQFLEPGAWDMVVDLTRDWFECEQVFLADFM